MDHATLATTAASFLVPYLVKTGEKAAETIGEKLPTAVSAMWNLIRTKFKGKPVAEEAITDLAVKPDDQLNQAAFTKQLKKMLESDSAFAVECEHLLNSAQHQSSDTIVSSGPVATHGGVAATTGGVAIKGNVQGNLTVGETAKKG